MSVLLSPLERFRELGGELFLDGATVRYRIPDVPEAKAALEELRSDKHVILQMLQDAASEPPSLSEIQANLPPGVKLVSYQPKQAPFAVIVAAIVTNAGKFYRAYLGDLARRIEKPKGYNSPPLADILSKLADAGLELQVERRQ